VRVWAHPRTLTLRIKIAPSLNNISSVFIEVVSSGEVILTSGRVNKHITYGAIIKNFRGANAISGGALPSVPTPLNISSLNTQKMTGRSN